MGNPRGVSRLAGPDGKVLQLNKIQIKNKATTESTTSNLNAETTPKTYIFNNARDIKKQEIKLQNIAENTAKMQRGVSVNKKQTAHVRGGDLSIAAKQAMASNPKLAEALSQQQFNMYTSSIFHGLDKEKGASR